MKTMRFYPGARPRLRAIALGVLAPLSLFALALGPAGCGGGGDNDDDETTLAGTYRIVEIGSEFDGTAPCPREIDLNDTGSATLSCSGDDTFELRRNGDFFSSGDNADGGPPTILLGEWLESDDGRRVTVYIEENRLDENRDGRIDENEVLRFDPPLPLYAEVRERNGSRLVLDIEQADPFDERDTLRFRTVLERR